MNPIYVAGALLSTGLLIYLIYALVKAEDF